MLSSHGALPSRSQSGQDFQLGLECKRSSTSSKKMPHVTHFCRRMGKSTKGAAGKKKNSRARSDLLVGEFGGNSRYDDRSLSGKQLSPHWNKSAKVS